MPGKPALSDAIKAARRSEDQKYQTAVDSVTSQAIAEWYQNQQPQPVAAYSLTGHTEQAFAAVPGEVNKQVKKAFVDGALAVTVAVYAFMPAEPVPVEPEPEPEPGPETPPEAPGSSGGNPHG